MRDLMVLASMLVLVPLALSSPFRAYLLWGWSSLLAINFYLYGFMASVPFNFIFALIAIGMILAGKDSEKGKLEYSRTLLILVAFLIHATLAAFFAYPDLARNWEIHEKLVKAMIFCFFMPIVLTRRYRIHAFIIALVLGLAFHALIEGLKMIASAGGHRVVGLSKFGDNNLYAIAMIMIAPFVLYLYQYSKTRWVRVVCIITVALLPAAVIGTNSRGGLLGLMALGGWLIFIGRRKLQNSLVVALAVVVVFALAPSTWWQRMDTIQSADQDHSFMGRVVAWKISSAIALSNPVFGGGIHAIENQAVWDRFRYSEGLLGFVETPVPDTRFHAAHSIYFEVLGDLGIVGWLIFMALLVNAFITRAEIKKQLADSGPRQKWISDLADLITASFVAYMVGGAAVGMGYFELVYILAMLMEILKSQSVLVCADKSNKLSFNEN